MSLLKEFGNLRHHLIYKHIIPIGIYIFNNLSESPEGAPCL